MLRLLVLLLLLANLGFAAWTQGWLDNLVGIRARGDREPERLARQVRPEAVILIAPAASASGASAAAAAATSVPASGAAFDSVPASASASASVAASASASAAAAVGVVAASGVAIAAAGASAAAAGASACLQTSPFDAVQVLAAEAALKALDPPLPAGSWTDEKTERPGTWLVYMGRYAGSAPLEKKEEELNRRKLDYVEVHLPGLEPGLSLGRFDSKAAADDALAAFSRQGIRTARVVKAGEPTTAHRLRFERAEPALAARLAGLQGKAAFGGGFVACEPKPAAN